MDGPAELVLLGERIGWLHDKLKELEQQKYQFLRHVSHELKTPLAVLRGGGSALRTAGGTLSGDQQGDLPDAGGRTAAGCRTLIERLLDFNRLSQQEVFSLTAVPWRPCCQTCPKSTGWRWNPSKSVYTCRPSPSVCRPSPIACDSSSTTCFPTRSATAPKGARSGSGRSGKTGAGWRWPTRARHPAGRAGTDLRTLRAGQHSAPGDC